MFSSEGFIKIDTEKENPLPKKPNVFPEMIIWLNIDLNLQFAWKTSEQHICEKLMRAKENAEPDTDDDDGAV